MADTNAPVGDQEPTVSGVESIWQQDVDNDVPSFVNLFDKHSESVCDFGDVILNVDDGWHPAIKIQVSSCILATASKVFKALFSNRYAEGQAMRAEHQTPTEILVKDSPKDLLLLCKLLHWQGDSRPSSHRQLRGFALIVDKYDCVEAMRHVSLSLFNPISLDDLSEHELFDLVTAAYFLDEPETFQKLTRRIVFVYGNTLSEAYERYTELLPSNFIPSLSQLQVSASQELTYGLTSFVGSLTSSAFVKQMPNYACQFLMELQEHDLWPLDLNKSSLANIVLVLPTVHVPVLEAGIYPQSPFLGRSPDSEDEDENEERSVFGDVDFGWVDRNNDIAPRQRQRPSQQTLESLAERVREHCAGLCLDCLKGNENCRLPHPTLQRAQTFIVSQPVRSRGKSSPPSSYGGWSHRWE